MMSIVPATVWADEPTPITGNETNLGEYYTTGDTAAQTNGWLTLRESGKR